MLKTTNILSIIFGVLISFLFLTSCEEEKRQPDAQSDSQELCFYLSNITRSSQEGFFERGDKIGVFVYSNGQLIANNYAYQYNGHNFIPEKPELKINDPGGSVTVYAYSPYNSTSTINKVTHEILSQESVNNWESSDFLTAKSVNIQSKYIPLHFRREYSTLAIELLDGNDITSISLSGVNYKSIANLENNVTTTLSDKREIKLLKKDGQYLCTLPIQQLSSANILSFISHTGVTYKQKFNQLQLSKSKRHTVKADFRSTISYIFELQGKNNHRISSLGETITLDITSIKKSIRSGKTTDTPIGYTNNVNYNVDKDWIKVENGKIIIKENPSTKNRKASVIFTQKESNKTIQINISQNKKHKVTIEEGL